MTQLSTSAVFDLQSFAKTFADNQSAPETTVLPPAANDGALRSDLPPSKLGYLPLIDSTIPTLEDVIAHFGLKYTPEDFWLHVNAKLLSGLHGSELDTLNPFSIIEFLLVCKDNNLNPLKTEIAGFYDWQSHSIKTQILLDGYCKIFNTHPQTDGMEYICHEKTEVELTACRYVKDETGRMRAQYAQVKRQLPRTIECRIYRKDRRFPAVGCADIEDIGSSEAWQQHPLQMMRNRAFTRAARIAFNLEGASYSDAEDLAAQERFDATLQRHANEAAAKALQQKEDKLKAQEQQGAAAALAAQLDAASDLKTLDELAIKIQDSLTDADCRGVFMDKLAKKRTALNLSQESALTSVVSKLKPSAAPACDVANLQQLVL